MIKKVLVCVSLVALATSAFAVDTGAYVRGDVGFANIYRKEAGVTQKYHQKPTYNLGIGYKFDKNFRADLNGQMTKSKEANKVHYKSRIASVRGYYDFDNSSMFTPYLTAGLGYVQNKVTLPVKTTNHHYGYIVGFGSLINVAKNVDLDLGYRHSRNVNSGKKVSGYVHKISAGALFSF